jgi:hypothetical protein
MLVYIILPILAYMLTGCSGYNNSFLSSNARVTVDNNDGYTVFYGMVSASNINMGAIFVKLPTLTGISFTTGEVYNLVTSASNIKDNAIAVTPVKTFTINGTQTITSANPVLSITVTGLNDGDEVYFTRYLGNGTVELGIATNWKL